eukprot:scaffold310142_cov30-Tisochrysis_lutea.AAC.1
MKGDPDVRRSSARPRRAALYFMNMGPVYSRPASSSTFMSPGSFFSSRRLLRSCLCDSNSEMCRGCLRALGPSRSTDSSRSSGQEFALLVRRLAHKVPLDLCAGRSAVIVRSEDDAARRTNQSLEPLVELIEIAKAGCEVGGFGLKLGVEFAGGRGIGLEMLARLCHLLRQLGVPGEAGEAGER